MAKKPNFTVAGRVNPAAKVVPTESRGVALSQRAEPAPTPAPGQGRGPGRPRKKPIDVQEVRCSFGMDAKLHRAFKVYLISRGETMQDWLNAQIAEAIRRG